MPGGLQIQKDAGEKELGLSGQVEHSDGNGDVQELARLVAAMHQRIAGLQSGVSTPSVEERRATRDEIVRGMTAQLESNGSKPTPALVAIASLLAGLTDELKAPSTKSFAGGDLGKSFGAVEAIGICPYCKTSNTVQKEQFRRVSLSAHMLALLKELARGFERHQSARQVSGINRSGSTARPGSRPVR